MLHGCKQDPDDFAAGTNMNPSPRRTGCSSPIRVRPAAKLSSCWNWFRPGDQMRDAVSPRSSPASPANDLAEFGIEPGRVYVAGLSAGGAMAAVMAETYPDLYAAAGIHSGLPTGPRTM